MKDRPDLYSQKRDLVNSKKLFPEYKDLPSHALQDIITRVEKTFNRRKSEKRLKRLQRSLSRKKAIERVAKAHLKVSNQRKDFHYKTIKKLLSQGKHVAHEKLNIKGIARTRLAKSTHDAGWG